MGGSTFDNLKSLTRLDLIPNECINEDFNTPSRIVEMPRTINEQCGRSKNLIEDLDNLIKIATLQAELNLLKSQQRIRP